MKLIFFGAGYSSNYILPRLDCSFEIICTHNTEIKEERFDKNLKINRVTFSDFLKKKNDYLMNTTHILNSIPPIKQEDLVYNLLKDAKQSSIQNLKWFGYLSSTSVYGNHFGKWVDEKTNTKPTTKRGKVRKKIEDFFLKLHKKYNFPVHIFRLPGIYGPGRSALDKLYNGNKNVIIKPKQFFSRIFVEDIASAVILSMNNPTPGEIFNITDNLPCSSQLVTEFAANLLEVGDLKYINLNSTEINDMTKDFYKDNKRVSNKKIKKILGWTPKFENYKLGLEEIFKKVNGKNTSNNTIS